MCTITFLKIVFRFEDLVLMEEGGIPTSPFLECCRDMIPFFGKANGCVMWGGVVQL